MFCRSVFLLLCALVLLGCGAGETGPESPSGPREGVVAQIVGASSDRHAREFAEVETSRCMAERGFDYEPEPVTDAFDPMEQTREDAQARGFGLVASGAAEGEAGVDTEGPNEATLSGLAPGQREEWLRNASECRNLAFEEGISQLQDAYDRLSPGLQREIEDLRSFTHHDLAEAVEGWSSCMAAQGYAYEAPFDLLSDLLSELDRLDPDDREAVQELEQRERDLAVASHDCQVEHIDERFGDVLADLESRARDQLGDGFELYGS